MMRIFFLFAGILLSQLLFAQNQYHDWYNYKTESVLTHHYSYTDEQRNEQLIALADSGNARAMYYLTTKYEHPRKSSLKLIMESAEKGYFMAECELGQRFLCGNGFSQNTDSAYHWLQKVVCDIEPYIKNDLQVHSKLVKNWQTEHKLSKEYERIATYALARSALSQYYMEKGRKDDALKSAKEGYDMMSKIYWEPKGRKPNANIYVELIKKNFDYAVRYLTIAYWITGNSKKALDINGRQVYSDGFPESYYKEGVNFVIANKIDLLYSFRNPHPLSQRFYYIAAENGSYLSMQELIRKGNENILNQTKRLAISGDSVAAMIYIHHQLANKDTISVNNLLKEIPFSFRFNWDISLFSDDIPHSFLNKDDVYYLLKNNALHTDTESILYLIDKYIDKYNHKIDAPRATCLYEILLSQQPDYTPKPILKQNICACYYNISDYKKALPIMMEICDVYPNLYPAIGEILYEGYTEAPNYTTALSYLHKAEKQKENEMKSQTFYYLGMCYLKGNGVEKDEKRGFEYMKKAVECKTILVKAFRQLSNCYRFGRGVEQDINKAEELLKDASKYGDEDAKSLLELQGIY